MINISKASQSEMRAVLRDIGKIDPNLRKDLQRKFKAATEKVASVVRERMAKRSGNMAKRTRAGTRSGQAEIRAKAEYTRIVERGGKHLTFGKPDSWVYQEPQPAIFPTVIEHQKDYFNEANRALAETLRELRFK